MKHAIRQRPPSATEAIILALLVNGERYGLEIRRLYTARTGRSLPYGSLYTTLHRMEDKHLIDSRIGTPTKKRGGNGRKYFRLTANGSEALAHFEASLFGDGEVSYG